MVANVEGRTMKRGLTPMDRAMAIKATEKFYSSKEKNDYRGMIRLEKVRDRLDIEGLVEWQDAQREAQRASLIAWQKQDEDSPGSAGSPPRIKRSAMLGEPSEYLLPLTMDGVIREALKAMEWESDVAYFAVHACEAFGLTLDDGDFDLPKEALDASR